MDEIQHIPESFGIIRGIVDRAIRENRDHGLFLFLGSASLDLLKQTSGCIMTTLSENSILWAGQQEFLIK